MTNIKRLTAAAFTVSLLSAAPAFAGGSGGGGGGGAGSFGGASSPSQQAYNPVVDYQAGLKFLQSSKFKKADRAFGKVIKATRRNANANYYMGLAKVGQEKHKSSIRYFKAAARYNKTLYEAHGGLGAAYAKSNKAEKAKAVLATLDGFAAECGTCAQAPRIKAAQNKINAALSGGVEKTAYLSPQNADSVETQYFASVSLINQGQYQAAFEDLSLAAAAAGPHPDITTYMGYTQRKLGNYDLAKSYYAMALDVAPNHKGANEYLGELYVETGEIDKAKAQLAKLETICSFGCIEENELRGWIVKALP
jgi:tetratricopeptide (TPR) repeat protein